MWSDIRSVRKRKRSRRGRTTTGLTTRTVTMATRKREGEGLGKRERRWCGKEEDVALGRKWFANLQRVHVWRK